MIYLHLGAGAADLDRRANFRCGFTELIKKILQMVIKYLLLKLIL